MNILHPLRVWKLFLFLAVGDTLWAYFIFAEECGPLCPQDLCPHQYLNYIKDVLPSGAMVGLPDTTYKNATT